MTVGQKVGVLCATVVLPFSAQGYELKDDAYHVFPPDDLQEVLNIAATNKAIKAIKVHEGTFVPKSPGQALIYLNRKHDGIHLLGIGRKATRKCSGAGL